MFSREGGTRDSVSCGNSSTLRVDWRASAGRGGNELARALLAPTVSRKVPTIPNASGFLDFRNVREVASEIASTPPALTGPVCFFHHNGNVRVQFNEFAQRMGELYGGEFTSVNPSEWLKAAAACGMNNLLLIHLKANMESDQPTYFPYLGR